MNKQTKHPLTLQHVSTYYERLSFQQTDKTSPYLTTHGESFEGIGQGLVSIEFCHERFVEVALHVRQTTEQHVLVFGGEGCGEHCVPSPVKI